MILLNFDVLSQCVESYKRRRKPDVSGTPSLFFSWVNVTIRCVERRLHRWVIGSNNTLIEFLSRRLRKVEWIYDLTEKTDWRLSLPPISNAQKALDDHRYQFYHQFKYECMSPFPPLRVYLIQSYQFASKLQWGKYDHSEVTNVLHQIRIWPSLDTLMNVDGHADVRVQ